MNNKFLIIDGYALIFRAFFAYPEHLTAPDGSPINALLGFYTLLLQAIDKMKPDYFCICLDHKDKSFRHDIYPDYKAKRESPPEILIAQLQRLRDVLKESELTFIEKSGFEADDLIGCLTNQDWAKSMDIHILTGDMDLLQLVNEHVRVLMPQRGAVPMKVMDKGAVQEKYQISPDQVIDYKALRGDSSDNIPGVRGIGEKTAVKLLDQFKSLDALYKAVDQAGSASIQKKLNEGKASAYLSKDLATIRCDINLGLTQNDCIYQPNWKAMLALFKDLSFRTLYAKYRHLDELVLSKPKGEYRLIENEADLKKLLPDLKQGFAIDLETDALSTLDANILGVALSVKAHQSFYIALPKPILDLFSVQLAPADSSFLNLLKPLLEDEKVPKITHHGKYEYQVLQRYGITLRGMDFDTLLAAYLLYPGQSLGLKDLVSEHLGVEMTRFEDLVSKGGSLLDVDVKDVAAYAGADADFTLQLQQRFEPLLKEKGLWPLFKDIEMPTQILLAKMERAGVCIDRTYLKKIEMIFDDKLQKIKEKIYAEAQKPFNLNSPQQLASFLYDELGLPVLKKTKTGRSTDASVLEKLKDAHACIADLLIYRSLEKLQGTYVKSLPALLHPSDQRLHTSFNQTVVITGRLSSSSPNLQNIPIRSEEGQKIRRAFIPSRSENKILSLDYSQIELRILAQLSQDQVMIKAFRNGQDIHQETAAMVFGCDVKEVTKEQRYQAKAVNFGIIYGVSAFSLSQQLGISNGQAKQIIEDYYQQFPTIKSFMDETIAKARIDGFVRTAYGRYRPLPDIKATQVQRRNFAERTAVNTRIQGTAADVMKLAMISVDDLLAKECFKSTLIIQVHDELVLDVDSTEILVLPEKVKACMQNVVDYDVPLDVDAVLGDNWQEIS